MITAPRCRHIKTNGLTCKSPALRGASRCYFHQRQMLRHARFNEISNTPSLVRHGEHMPLVPVEDHDSIQLALSMVINGLAVGHLEPVRARALLYGLQIASLNARNTRLEPTQHHDLSLETESDPIGDDLAQSGDRVDITNPSVLLLKQEAEARAENSGDEDEEDDDEDEDDDTDYNDEEDEEGDGEIDDDELDETDDLKVLTEVDDFMRRNP